MIGRKLGHYAIEGEIGRGGMGVVYRAVDTRLGRTVALKALREDLTADPERLERFEREARAVASLDHPNIVTLFSIEDEGDVRFLTMELVEGSPLSDHLREPGLALERIVELAEPLADALAAAHGQGVVHRDLKPGNLLVTRDGRLKVVDFGLAKLLAEEAAPLDSQISTQLHTRQGVVVGTTPYMSPEQLRGAAVDHRSDIFSTGITLYEMATGRRPFEGPTPADVSSAILSRQPESVRELRPDLPPELSQIIGRCLAKDPEKRYQSAGELRDHLARLRARRRPRAARLAAAFSLVAVLALGSWFWLDRRGAPGEPWAALGKPAPEESRLMVTVVEFANNTGDPALDWLEKGLQDMVVTHLSESEYLRLLGPEALGPTTDPLSGGRMGSARARDNGAVLVKGSVLRSGARLKILGQLSDAQSRDVLEGIVAESEGIDSLLAAAEDFGDRVRVALEIRATGSYEVREGVSRTKTGSLEAYEQYVTGRDLGDQRYYEKAISHLRRATELDPCFAHAHDLLAHAYMVLGERTLARESIETAIACAERLSEVERIAIRRRLAQLDKNVTAELGHLRELVMRQPENSEWHFLLGWHLFNHHRSCDEGLREYEKALELMTSPRPRIYVYQAQALFGCADAAAGLESLRRYRELRPDDPYGMIHLGSGYLRTGDYAAARELFESALQADPGYLRANFHLAEWNLALGQFEEGRDRLARYRAAEAAPRARAEADVLLAQASLEAGEPELASRYAARALAADPEMQLALWVTGLAQIAQGDEEGAAATLGRMRELLAASGSHNFLSLVEHLRGRIRLFQGDFALAIGAFEAALAAAPDDYARYRHELAKAHYLAGNDQQAVESCRQALAFNPNHPPCHRLLADVYQRLGQLDLAAESSEKFRRLWAEADQDLI